jgi:nitrogen fixation protein FixH
MSEKKSAWRSPWIIGWVAMVVIFFTMNMIMIYLAKTNNPGLVVEDFYDRGQDYEQNMLKRQARNPGWQMVVEFPKKIEPNTPFTCHYRVTDKEGVPIDPDGVIFYAYRPSDAKQDFQLPMKRIETGIYEVEVNFVLKGVWDTLVSARQGEDEYNTPQRVSVGIDLIP